MGSDSVDIFEKVIFNIPGLKKVVSAIIFSGLLSGFLFILCVNVFTSLSPGVISAVLVAFLALILPSLILGELLYRFLPDYPRNWGYFLALSDQVILSVYFLVLTGANSLTNAWHIFWLALATVYMANLLVLLLTMGYEYVTRISLLSATQPVILLFVFHLFLGAEAGLTLMNYIVVLGVLAVAGVLLASVFLVAEYLISVNTENVSVLQLTAGLLQKRQEALEIGYETCPDVQTLEIINSSRSTRLCIPWIHPGPLEGFGGGRITSDIINQLNQDGEGFFLHVPSTHKSDPADPEDYKKLLEAMEEPEKTGKVSRMIEKNYENVKFYGRRIGEKDLIFMDADWDDYELSVFREVIDPEETIIVDLHCQDRNEEEREEVWYNTAEAKELRSKLEDFRAKLQEEELYGYNAGFNTVNDEESIFALVERVDGQETVLFGIEGNGTSQDIRDLRKELRRSYDEVVVFSTDTHQSIHELSSDQQADASRIEECIKEAERSLSPANIGFSNLEASKMKLLQEDYSSLIFSINILIRLLVLSLVFVYLWITIWLFF